MAEDKKKQRGKFWVRSYTLPADDPRNIPPSNPGFGGGAFAPTASPAPPPPTPVAPEPPPEPAPEPEPQELELEPVEVSLFKLPDGTLVQEDEDEEGNPRLRRVSAEPEPYAEPYDYVKAQTTARWGADNPKNAVIPDTSQPGQLTEDAFKAPLKAKPTEKAPEGMEGVSFDPSMANPPVPENQQQSPQEIAIMEGIGELDKLLPRGGGGRTVNQATTVTTTQKQHQLDSPELQEALDNEEMFRRHVENSVLRQGQIQQQEGEAAADTLDTLHGELEARNAEDEARRAEQQETLKRMLTRQEESIAKFSEAAGKFDANRLLSKESGRGLVFALAAGLGAISAVRTGVNPALSTIEKIIDRDVETQMTKLKANQAEVAMSGKLFQDMRNLYGDDEAAAAATRAGLYEAATVKVRSMASAYQGEAAAEKAEEIAAGLNLKAAEERTKTQRLAAGIVTQQTTVKPVRIGGGDPLKRYERLVALKGKALDNAMKQKELVTKADGTEFDSEAKNRIQKVAYELANVRSGIASIKRMQELNDKGTGLLTGGLADAFGGGPLARAGAARFVPTDAANRTQELMDLGERASMQLVATEQGKQVSDTERKAMAKSLANGATYSDDDRKTAYVRELSNAKKREQLLLQTLADPEERRAVEAAASRMNALEQMHDLGSDPRLTPIEPE